MHIAYSIQSIRSFLAIYPFFGSIRRHSFKRLNCCSISEIVLNHTKQLYTNTETTQATTTTTIFLFLLLFETLFRQLKRERNRENSASNWMVFSILFVHTFLLDEKQKVVVAASFCVFLYAICLLSTISCVCVFFFVLVVAICHSSE